MTKCLLAIIAALSLVSILTLWRLDHVTASLDASTERVRELEASNESRRNTMRLLADLDTEHTQERERANQTNANLRAAVATGERRLSVLAKCPVVRADAYPGVDAAEARAELNPAAAERIISVGPDGDDAIRQLNALIDTVRAACPLPK
ncbi:lysis protein [Pseudomonas sp. P66]|uniref:Lysis protein n=1 Tax=Pseudomonas arcuscaelestis TaxID=2710591 RepID=A0ABS2C311_9PSED|nr:lysis system i-spanin subunit Rz [Pseudomonas arcuscaelestis]MBM5460275.1 lysis protein [Pseudomonas arcuscaelestis]